MIIIIIIIKFKMNNIIKFPKHENEDFNQKSINQFDKVNKLYYNLVSSGFSSCEAYHEAMKLLLVSNPSLDLAALSQETFKIINPLFHNYYENGIDNHSQN